MLRGFFSSDRYSTIFSSESERPNQVKYHVRNGTMMKSEATMMSQILLGRRGLGATTACASWALACTKSSDICHLRFVIVPLIATEGTGTEIMPSRTIHLAPSGRAFFHREPAVSLTSSLTLASPRGRGNKTNPKRVEAGALPISALQITKADTAALCFGNARTPRHSASSKTLPRAEFASAARRWPAPPEPERSTCH